MSRTRRDAPEGLVPADLERFAGLRIAVVGDVMLDEYLRGPVGRMSPEAPVPVIGVETHSRTLGGAANVAHQLVALGATVDLVGVIGRDEAGSQLAEACRDIGIDDRSLFAVGDRVTTRKLRVMADHQHVARLDFEDARPVTTDTEQAIVAAVGRAEGVDAIVISDYAKGVVTDAVVSGVIAFGRQWGVPVLVDPKHTDLSRYRGATVIKTNRAEFEAAIGHALVDETLAGEARELAVAANADALVVTLGERGLIVVPSVGDEVWRSAAAEEVFDVSGAGDTVIAVLALALASGTSLASASMIATLAAGIAISRSGVTVVGRDELAARVFGAPLDKIVGLDRLGLLLERWRLEGQRIVFTNGCFDLFHAGHLHLLRSAAELGDVLIVGIDSDASVRALKGEDRPLVPAADRMAVVAALGLVDAVVQFESDELGHLIESVRPDVLVKGGDYLAGEVVGREIVEVGGGSVVLVPLLPDRSTTVIVDRIRADDLSATHER